MTGLTYNLFPDLPQSSKKTKKRKYFPQPALTHADRQQIAEVLVERGREMIYSGWSTGEKTGQRLISEAGRFCDCGRQFALFECRPDSLKFRSPMSCNSRICEVCGRRYAKSLEPYITAMFDPLLSKPRRGYGLFLLTLTTTTKRFGPEGPSRKDIARFYRESGKFLKLFYGKHKTKLNSRGQVVEIQNRCDRIKRLNGKTEKISRKPKLRQGRGGKWVCDWRHYRGAGYLSSVELGGKNNMLHCHCIVYGPYVPMKKLRAEWLALTGDSFIVDIKQVKQAQKAARYVLKYIVKPPAVPSYVELANYAIRIKGTRRIRTGGIFFGRIRRHKKEGREMCCPYCLGKLEYTGTQTVDDTSTHDSLPLYKMLDLMTARGSPLDLPVGHMTADQRMAATLDGAQVERDRGSGIIWLDKPVTLQDIAGCAADCE